MNRQAQIALAAIAAVVVIAILIIAFAMRGDGDDKSDLIRVNAPRSGELVSSPLIVEGEARGTWFFEASFPVTLLDGNGNVLVQTFATALSDWMTEDFVAFRTTVEFTNPPTNRGTLVLAKDNPSGLPEFDDEIRIEVRFRDD